MPRHRGRRGAGSITRRDGKYQARWSSTEGGKRVRKSATFDFRTDAEWWLRQAGRGAVPESLTVATYLERWLAGKRSIAASTRAQYRNHVELHIVPALGGFALIALQPKHVEAFVAERERHVSDSTHRPLTPRTVQAILTTLRSALEDAVPRLIPDNPAAKVEAPRVRREPVRAMTRSDAAALIEAVRDTWMEQIVRFLLGSGLRIGEAVALNQGNVHDGWVELVKSKTTLRAVPISDDALAAAREAIAAAPRVGKREPVFFGVRVTEDGHRDRLARSSLDHALPRLLESKGLPRLTPHLIRHATATLMVANGVPMRQVAEQLGHANPALTSRVYSHVSPESARAALSVLDEAVKG
jgi:integrase